MVNGVVCSECGEMIFSRYRHDFRLCGCGNVSVDGGNDYFKYGYTKANSSGEITTVELDTKYRELSSLTTLSNEEIKYVASHLKYDQTIYDPMAGTGSIAVVRQHKSVNVFCKEIEPEWICKDYDIDRWYIGSSTEPLQTDEKFDWIIFEPPNGDRKSDHANFSHSRGRHTYQEALDKDLHENNVARMNWGPTYRTTMQKIYKSLKQNIGSNTGIILIIQDNLLSKNSDVVEFHLEQIKDLRFEVEDFKRFNNTITPFNNDDIKLAYVFKRSSDEDV